MVGSVFEVECLDFTVRHRYSPVCQCVAGCIQVSKANLKAEEEGLLLSASLCISTPGVGSI